VVLFGSKKPDIGWLEYWIYLCNGKKKLPEWAYMAESPSKIVIVYYSRIGRCSDRIIRETVEIVDS